MRKFEFRFALVLLLLIALVSVSGYLMHSRLTSVVDRSSKNAQPDPTILTLHKISSFTNNAELIVKSFRLTKDTTYRNRYNLIKDSLSAHAKQLNNQTKDESFYPESKRIDSIIHVRMQIFDSLLFLDDYFRVQKVLTEVQEDINKISDQKLQDTVKNDTIKDGFFARVFRSKKKREQIEAMRNQSLVNWSEEIDRLVAEVRKEEKYIENQMKKAEINLLNQDSLMAAKMSDVLLSIEHKRQAKIAEDSSFAKRQVKDVNRIITIYVILAVILLLFIAIMITFYIRRNSKYKKMLKKTSDEAFRLAKLRKQFMANMSHEIRTPLNSILGFTNLLHDTPLTKEQLEHVEIIRASNHHLLSVVNDVLDFSKLEVDKMQLQNKPFDISNLLEEVGAMFNKKAEEKGVKLIIENELTTSHWVGDAYRIKQVLINLVGNAIKFTEKGFVKIKLDNHSELKIIIQDTGVGMTEDELEHIFNAFEQASSNEIASHKGTGLGLAISKKIIEAYKGEINVSSQKGVGTTFTVKLPLKESKVGSQEYEAVKEKMSISKNINVLVADDEVFNQKLMKALLDKFKIEHEIVGDGKATYKQLKERKFDYLLLDVRMPEMDGFQFLTEYRSQFQDLKIYVLTAALSEEDHEALIDLGVDGILFKPFDEDDLHAVFANSEKQTITKKNTMPYNLESLEQASGGDDAFIVDMLETLLESIKDTRVSIPSFYNEKNWQALAEKAHKLAGATRHIEAHESYTLLKRIEKNARSESGLNEIPSDVKLLEEQLNLLAAGLRKELQKYKK